MWSRAHEANEVGFLRSLLVVSSGEDRRRWLDSMERAERAERRSRRWAALLCLLSVLFLGGLFLLPDPVVEALRHPASPGPRMVVLASGVLFFGAAMMLGCWIWHRNALLTLCERIRRYVVGLALERSAAATWSGAVRSATRAGSLQDS